MTVADGKRVDRYEDSRGDIDYESLDTGAPDRHRVGADVYETTATVDGETRSVSLVRPRVQGELASAASAYIDGVETWAAVDDHEGVCTVLDWGATEDGPWVATERAGGETLRDRLDAIDADEAIAFASQCAEALEHLHGRRVYHHALTPERILVADGEVRLLDTGTGAALDRHVGGVGALTTAYAAPEQFDTEQFGSPDTYTDVYQIGAVLYTMLTGQPPYRGSQTCVMNDVTNGSLPDPPSSLREGIPEALDEAVLTALERHKPDRYADVSRLEERLYSIRTDDQCVNVSETVSQTDAPKLSTGSCQPENRTRTPQQQSNGTNSTKDDADDVDDCRETTPDPHVSARVESDNSDGSPNSISPRVTVDNTAPKQPQQTESSAFGQDSGWFHPSSFPEAPPRRISTDLQTVRKRTEADTVSEAIDECQPSTLADVLRTMDAGHSQ